MLVQISVELQVEELSAGILENIFYTWNAYGVYIPEIHLFLPMYLLKEKRKKKKKEWTLV